MENKTFKEKLLKQNIFKSIIIVNKSLREVELRGMIYENHILCMYYSVFYDDRDANGS